MPFKCRHTPCTMVASSIIGQGWPRFMGSPGPNCPRVLATIMTLGSAVQ